MPTADYFLGGEQGVISYKGSKRFVTLLYEGSPDVKLLQLTVVGMTVPTTLTLIRKDMLAEVSREMPLSFGTQFLPHHSVLKHPFSPHPACLSPY